MASLRQIRYFLTVADFGAFTSAADALFIAQPALSRQVAQLEEELGFALFERWPRGVRLTPAGALYRERMQGVLRQLDLAAEEGRDLAHGQGGVLRLLHSSSIPVPVFLPWLQQLMAKVPRLRIDLDRVSSELQIAEVAAGKADLGLVRLPLLRRDPTVELHALPAERLWVALPLAHPLLGQGELSLADLREQPFVSAVHRERGGLARCVADLCLQRGFVPALAAVISRKTAMLDLVAARLGVAVIPAGLAAQAGPGVVCRPLVDADAWAQSALAVACDPAPLALRLLQLIIGAAEVPATSGENC